MYLLTEWEGRAAKHLARGHGIRTERNEVRAPWPRAKYFPVRPDLTQSISILSYDHNAFPFISFSFLSASICFVSRAFSKASDITLFIWEASEVYLNSANCNVQNSFFGRNNLQSKVLIFTKSRSRSKLDSTIHKLRPICERRLQGMQEKLLIFIWRFNNMTAAFARERNVWRLLWSRGFRKDKILDIYYIDFCSRKYTRCLVGLLNGSPTWLVWIWFRLRVFFATQNFRHLTLLLMRCYGDATAMLRRSYPDLRLLWPLSWGTLLCDTPESRSVSMQVFLTEWLVYLPLLDNGKSFVAFERNFRILLFPIGLFKNQIWSSGFLRWRTARKKGLSGDLAAVGRLLTNSLKQDSGHFLSPVSYAFGRKDLRCSFSSPWRVLLSLSVLHSRYS